MRKAVLGQIWRARDGKSWRVLDGFDGGWMLSLWFGHPTALPSEVCNVPYLVGFELLFEADGGPAWVESNGKCPRLDRRQEFQLALSDGDVIDGDADPEDYDWRLDADPLITHWRAWPVGSNSVSSYLASRPLYDATPIPPPAYDPTDVAFKKRPSRTYLAGPMSGLPDDNFPAFHAAAGALRAIGQVVENPAENPAPADPTWENYLRAALTQMLRCDSILLLPGWEESRGAKLEKYVAEALGMTVLFADQRQEQATNG